jgi:hypothetical protein
MSDYLLKALRSTAKAGSLLPPYPEVINAAADRIEQLERALYETTTALRLVNNCLFFSEKYAAYCDELLEANKKLIIWKFNQDA